MHVTVTIVLCIQVLFLLSILLTDKDTLQIVFFLIKCYQTIVLPYKEYIWKNCLTFIQLVSRNRKASKHYSQSITHKAFSLDLCMLETVQLNLVACAQSSLPVFISPQSSSVRSPLTGNAHALGTRLDITKFLLVTLKEQPSSQGFSFEEYRLFCTLNLHFTQNNRLMLPTTYLYYIF